MARFTAMAAAVVLAVLMVVPVPEVEAKRWTVGDNKGWTSNVNYTDWARGKHFYIDDWLFFVYDRNQMSVLEVNKTNYENCISDHPIRNHTTGAGRDVAHLNVTRHYYFISGNGFCFSGMKLAVRVEKLPPPPSSSPAKNAAAASLKSAICLSQLIVPTVVAVGAIWNLISPF